MFVCTRWLVRAQNRHRATDKHSIPHCIRLCAVCRSGACECARCVCAVRCADLSQRNGLHLCRICCLQCSSSRMQHMFAIRVLVPSICAHASAFNVQLTRTARSVRRWLGAYVQFPLSVSTAMCCVTCAPHQSGSILADDFIDIAIGRRTFASYLMRFALFGHAHVAAVAIFAGAGGTVCEHFARHQFHRISVWSSWCSLNESETLNFPCIHSNADKNPTEKKSGNKSIRFMENIRQSSIELSSIAHRICRNRCPFSVAH